MFTRILYGTTLCFVLLAFGTLTTFGQTAPTRINLKFGEPVEESFDLTRAEDDSEFGTILLRLTFSSMQDKDILTLSPQANLDQGDFIFLFEGDMTLSKLRRLNIERGNNKFVRDVSQLSNFLTVIDYPDALIHRSIFETGVNFFTSTPTDPIQFEIHQAKLPASKNLDIIFNLYYGTSSLLTGRLKSIEVTLIFPDTDVLCEETLAKYPFDSKDFPDLATANALFEKASQSNSEKELSDVVQHITQSIASIRQLIQIRDNLQNEAVLNSCASLVSRLNEINAYLTTNSIGSYESLAAKGEQRITEIKCNQAHQEFSRSINQLVQPLNFEKIQQDYNQVIRSNDLGQMNETRRNINAYITDLNALNQLKARITASKLDCQQFSQILTEINKHTETRRIAEEYRSSLDHQIGTAQSCIEFIDARRQDLHNISSDINNMNFEGRIADLYKTRDQIENLLSVTPFDEDRVNSQISSTNSELGTIENEITAHLGKLTNLSRLISNRSDCSDPDILVNIGTQRTSLNNNQEHIRTLRESLRKFFGQTSELGDAIMQEINSTLNPDLQKIIAGFSSIYKNTDEVIKKFEAQSQTGRFYPMKQKRLLDDLESQEKKNNALYVQFEQAIENANKQSDSLLNMPLIYNDSVNLNRLQIISNHSELNNEITSQISRIRSFPGDSYPYILLVSVLLGIVVLLFGARVYFRALRMKKNPVVTENKTLLQKINENKIQGGKQEVKSDGLSTKVGGVKITRTATSADGRPTKPAGEGLQHIQGNALTDYYEINLNTIWADTMVRKVFIHRECIKKTYKFYYNSLSAEGRVLETGGYLIGGWEREIGNDQYDISLEEFIEPGDDAIYGEYQLNFGAKIGVKLESTIRNLKEKLNRNLTLTGWFHSHPEIKIFLSNHDFYVQEQLSTKENKLRLIALVIDPITQDNGKIAFYTGIFSYKANGAMNNNDGSMKLIKWKELYDWARMPPTQDLKDFYCVEFHELFEKSLTRKLYWSNKSITKFSLFLDDSTGSKDTTGLFKGQVVAKGNTSNIVIFSDFVAGETNASEINGQDIVGKFICTDDIDGSIKQMNETLSSNNIHILIFCKNDKKDLWIMSRKTTISFNDTSEAKSIIAFSAIETWPTRRR